MRKVFYASPPWDWLCHICSSQTKDNNAPRLAERLDHRENTEVYKSHVLRVSRDASTHHRDPLVRIPF